MSNPQTSSSPSASKLRKMPHIPSRKRADDVADCGDSDMIGPYSLGLNQIRTRSVEHKLDVRDSENRDEDDGGVKPRLPTHRRIAMQGKKASWNQSKSMKTLSPTRSGPAGYQAAFAKEIQSPRFQAILRLTSGRKKRSPDIKAFSHELDSKGVRPLPFWKSRAFGRMQGIMVMIRSKFDKLKEEVNADLGLFAGDLVTILEKTSETNSEWKESLEDLLVMARQCATMPPSEFWFKCEGIVQNLDDRRQELPVGTLKQVHTRLLFILTRCTRLVQFQKESGFEEDLMLTSHQLSDLGRYAECISGPTLGWKENLERQTHTVDEQSVSRENYVADEVSTAKSVASSTGSIRMSSWKKLPSASEKNRKLHEYVGTASKGKRDEVRKETESSESTSICHDEHSEDSPKTQSLAFGGDWDQHHTSYEDSLICRICENEIPTVHVELHSRICTIADRCDLKGLTVNKRLERVADAIEKIIETWTPKSVDTVERSLEMEQVSGSSGIGELSELPTKGNALSRRCSEDMMGCVTDIDNPFVVNGLHNILNKSCDSALTTNPNRIASSVGSLTPRSPMTTPRMTQIELLLSEWEVENYQQVRKLMDIARSVANVNDNDYSTLAYMIEQLEDLKYAIQDRKVDALIVETFGRRIEKLLQEKYVILCGQIDDEKADLMPQRVAADDNYTEGTARSLRASPMNACTMSACTKDRTCIEDFEIIKPISRGAYGRVFLAKKRATGDLFAIKVLKKADMIRKNAVESILAERDILISVRNPFVVRFFYSFTCRENLYLVMEYLNGGDLFSLMKNLGCLEEDMARIYIAEVVLALEYLHSLNVIHRDLKPDNLLIGPDGHIKLTDFGLSKVGLINSTDDLSGPSSLVGDDKPKGEVHSSMKREQRKNHSVVGTPDYLAPEILLGTGHGATADWWSVGVILYELLVGIPPFNAEHPQQIFNNIMNRDIPWPKVPEEMSYEAHDLIDKLLNDNPLQRLGSTGAGEVKRHHFFKEINWNSLEMQKATFIPSADAHDTSYFMSRYIWNLEEENINEGSDCDDMSETSSASCSSGYSHDEDGDECGHLADFGGGPCLENKYSFSNFSFKNLSQLASINYDLVTKSNKESSAE